MANLAIIPARGGSKRIERKNIRDFFGKPVIAYPIAAAAHSGLFEEIMVSTDDKEIAQIAGQYGAQVPFLRGHESADDFATLADVVLEVLLQYRSSGREFDNVCCLLPTAALITSKRLIEGYAKFLEHQLSTLVPVLRFSYPIQRAFREEKGLLHMREPQYMMTRSQDLEPHYHDSGQYYWLKAGDFLVQKRFFTEKTGFIELQETEAQDVDTPPDWELLKIKYTFLNKQNKNA